MQPDVSKILSQQGVELAQSGLLLSLWPVSGISVLLRIVEQLLGVHSTYSPSTIFPL